MRIAWSLTLISLGGALVYSTRDDQPGFSAVRALGLALWAIGGLGLLPRYPATTNARPPARTPRAVPAGRAHVGPWAATAPVSGPALMRPARQLVPLPALPVPGPSSGVRRADQL